MVRETVVQSSCGRRFASCSGPDSEPVRIRLHRHRRRQVRADLMAASTGSRDERWYFAANVLESSPSRKCGIDADKELSYRQQAANMIQDMGQRLQVTQLCINTAIVYMHRFYVFHSFTKYHRTSIAACALFLAAKVEEQPRKLEYIIKALIQIQHQKHLQQVDLQAEAAKLVKHENVMLQTLGFDIAIEHPHTFVVKCCQMVRASKDLAQTCYFMATNSLHLTTMCLKYKPTLVACVCIHLACKWSSWQIPQSSEGKSWWNYVDAAVSVDRLEELTKEFLAILDKCPSRLKRKIMSGGGQGSGCDTLPPPATSESNNNSAQSTDVKSGDSEPQAASSRTTSAESQPSSSSSSALKSEAVSASVPSVPVAGGAPFRMSPGRFHPPAAKERQSYSVYKEKKEQERRENERKEAERHETERKRAEAEKAERDRRLEAERRVAAEQQREQERLDRERRQQEIQRRELEQREAERRAEAERREKERREKEMERREAEKREAEKREAEKREAEKRAEAELREQERLKAEKVAAEQREAERRDAELVRQREEEQKRLEEDRRLREEAERQQEAVPVHEDVKREAEKKNRFFTSRTPATATEPDSRPPAPLSFDDLVAKTRTEDLTERRAEVDRQSPHKHHKSPKSHKRKKSKHHHHKDKHKDRDKSRDKRHDKHEAEPLPPIKLKIKPLAPAAADPPAEPPAESFKIRIAKDRLLNRSSASAAADPDSSRKRKNSFEAASLSKKPVL